MYSYEKDIVALLCLVYIVFIHSYENYGKATVRYASV